jgi:hypothetical protein
MAGNADIIKALEKRQGQLIDQIQEARNEIELYEEDDTTYMEEDLQVLLDELEDVGNQLSHEYERVENE